MTKEPQDLLTLYIECVHSKNIFCHMFFQRADPRYSWSDDKDFISHVLYNVSLDEMLHGLKIDN